MRIKAMKLGAGLLSVLVPMAAGAMEPLSNLRYNIAGGPVNFDARMRYEEVDQDNAPAPAAPLAENEAHATTLRVRLGYTTAKWNELVAQIEYEGLSVVGSANGDDYNSFANGATTFPVIADEKVNELNQAWIRWQGIPKSEVKYGRQRILLDNQRFVGNVGWRQTEMTYDAALFSTTFIPKTKFTYAYVNNINSFRFFDYDPSPTAVRLSDNVDTESHLMNAAITAIREKLVITPYAYLLDFDDIPAGAPAGRLFQDSATYGLRVTGALPFKTDFTFSYALEYAEQKDYKDSPSTIDFNYLLVEPTLAWKKLVKGSLGYETLEGDGVNSVQTPLATAHAFVGWADQFLITPPGGLERSFVTVNTTVDRFGFTAVYHQFETDAGSVDLGDEINLLASFAVLPNFTLFAKYAAYSADSVAPGSPAVVGRPTADVDKTWLYAEYKF